MDAWSSALTKPQALVFIFFAFTCQLIPRFYIPFYISLQAACKLAAVPQLNWLNNLIHFVYIDIKVLVLGLFNNSNSRVVLSRPDSL